jgi:hypothetical protein
VARRSDQVLDRALQHVVVIGVVGAEQTAHDPLNPPDDPRDHGVVRPRRAGRLYFSTHCVLALGAFAMATPSGGRRAGHTKSSNTHNAIDGYSPFFRTRVIVATRATIRRAGTKSTGRHRRRQSQEVGKARVDVRGASKQALNRRKSDPKRIRTSRIKRHTMEPKQKAKTEETVDTAPRLRLHRRAHDSCQHVPAWMPVSASHSAFDMRSQAAAARSCSASVIPASFASRRASSPVSRAWA